MHLDPIVCAQIFTQKPVTRRAIHVSDTTYHYEVYGLALWTNRPLPGLLRASELLPADVSVTLGAQWPEEFPTGERDWVARSNAERSGRAGVRSWTLEAGGETYHRLRYAMGPASAEFIIDQRGCRVWAVFPKEGPFHDVVAYLLGPVLGCVLRLRGVTCLHASVVGIDGHALAIPGSRGRGKSTTAAALAQYGHAVLSDDIAVLTDDGTTFMVQPGYCRLRLWPPAVHALYGSSEGLPLVVSHADKRYVDLTSDAGAARCRFEPNPLPLKAIYLLQRRGGTAAVPAIKPVSGRLGLLALAERSYVDYMVSRALRAREFALLGKLVEKVPVRYVERPDGLATLPELCAAICDDFRRLIA